MSNRAVGLFLLCLLLLPSRILLAAEAEGVKSIQSLRGNGGNGGKQHAAKWYERFQPYRLNYAIWQFTSSDEDAAEVQYSFKYNLIDLESEDGKRIYNTYLAYTGKFDFYMGTRDSGPVINRTSNPSGHFRYGFHTGNKDTCWQKNEAEYCRSFPPKLDDPEVPTDPKSPEFDTIKQKYAKGSTWFIDLGIEHRSDGQVTDASAKDANGNYLTQIKYGQGNHEYFDGISVGSNYVSITPTWKYADSKGGIPFDSDKLEIETKIYFTNDSNVTWGPYAGTGRRFSDYDTVRIMYSHTQPFDFVHFRDVTAGVEYLIGKKGFATDSIDLYLVLPWYSKTSAWKIPFFVKSHFGPMDRLSNYTKPMRSIGVGLALAY